MKRILIMGLPGSGKTTLANALKNHIQDIKNEGYGITVEWFNADDVRKKYNDWDFTETGRIRQSLRMSELAEQSKADYVICDFVAPLPEMRHNFKADWTVWVDTIDAGRFADTNKAFVAPEVYDFRITEQDAAKWSVFIADNILEGRRRPVFDWQKETVQMLGRWQPWHSGHRALFERLLERTGQVIIQIRDVQGWQGSNPFGLEEVKNRIRHDLDPLYQGMYDIQIVPNIVHIGWGRGVGYSSGEETFDEDITKISGTQIRKEMGLE
jgi:energy-coupling factor transporter ATP-binding protein EcfA2